MAVIGDTQSTAKNTVVIALPQSVIATALVADVDDGVNVALLSGKKAGATIIVDEGAGSFAIYVAQGGLPVSPWVHTDGVTTITPA